MGWEGTVRGAVLLHNKLDLCASQKRKRKNIYVYVYAYVNNSHVKDIIGLPRNATRPS